MASGYDGTIRINTKIDNSGFNAGAKQLRTGIDGVLKSVKGLTAALGVSLSVLGLVKVGKEAITLASDLQEVQNVVDTAFKSMSYKMEEFAKTSIEKFGLSKLAAKQMGSTFMAMASNMVPSMEQASDMAVELTGRAADMASFYNKTASETATALNSIFTGETETLKRFGVVMTEANLQQYAYQKGIKKTINDMTQAEKVQLRYNYVMEQTALAAGDFERTSDSWANQTRILSEQFKELLSILGSGLVAVLTPAIQGLNQLLGVLINVANVLGTILSKLLGINSVQISSGGAAASDAYADAADSVDDYAKAVAGADKANKGSLASFDELENMKTSNSSGTGSDVAAGLSDITVEAVEGEEAVAQISERIEGIIAIANELASVFKEGFIDGFGDIESRIDNLSGSFESIKQSVMNIFSDGTVADSFTDMIYSLTYSAGEITGAFTSIGTTIGENLLGGVSYMLEVEGPSIKDWLISMFDLTSEMGTIQATFASALANIFSVFSGENATKLTGEIMSIFASIGMNVSLIFAQLRVDIADALTKPIVENQEGIKKALDELLGLFAEFASSTRETVDHAFSVFGEMYEEYIEPFLDDIGTGLSSITETLLTFWEETLKPIFDELVAKLDEIMNGSLQELITSVINAIGIIISVLGLLWNGFLVPFIQWFITNIAPTFMKTFNTISNIVLSFVNTAILLVADIIDIFAGIIKFFTDTFAGDWEGAWDGFVLTVKGCINLVIDFINGMIDALFIGINGVVDLINGLLNKIPETIRTTIGIGELSHFTPPQIPRLATGTVVPAGMSQFMAILGDNNKETEVVSPLSTMKEAVAEVLAEMGGTGQSGDIVINIDGREVFRVVRDQNREYKKTTGQSAFA